MARNPEEAALVVDRLSRRLRQRRPAISKRLNYLKGADGSLRFASDEFADYFKARFEGFSDNWTLPVAQATAERTNPLGVRLDAETSGVDKELARAWHANDCDAGFAEASLVTTAASRSFIQVIPTGDDLPIITWEHPEQCIVDYDPLTRRRRYGLITWTDDKFDHATLDTGKYLVKFQRPTGVDPDDDLWQATPLLGWQPRSSEGDDWVVENPLGVPALVEMANWSLLDGDPQSDIDPVMSMQDAINLVWSYLLNALDYASLPQRVAMGAEPPRVPILNEAGEVIGSRVVELDKLVRERIMFLPGDNISIGEWTSANLEVFSKVIEHAVEHIAAQTRTPPHYLVAKLVNTAAESLTISEAGLVSKVQERIRFWTPALREMYRLVALAQGDEKRANAVRTGKILWADVQYRSEAQRADALSKKRQMGYPLEYLLELDGVPPEDIPRILAMSRREAELDPVADIARGLAATGSAVPDGDGE